MEQTWFLAHCTWMGGLQVSYHSRVSHFSNRYHEMRHSGHSIVHMFTDSRGDSGTKVLHLPPDNTVQAAYFTGWFLLPPSEISWVARLKLIKVPLPAFASISPPLQQLCSVRLPEMLPIDMTLPNTMYKSGNRFLLAGYWIWIGNFWTRCWSSKWR